MSIYGPVFNPNLLGKFPPILPRRKVFISYFKGDKPWVDSLIAHYGQPSVGVFIPCAVGVTEEDDFVDSDDVDYIMQAIRDRYLEVTSVTIVIIGPCTHSRKFVDWEIKSSLTQPANGRPNGLLGLEIPPPRDWGGNPVWHHLPGRFLKNYIHNRQDISYARYYVWPSSASDLRRWIEEVYGLASQNAYLIENPQDMIRKNLVPCQFSS